MILTCPSCSAQYFADDKAIGEAGRTVRCAACSHSWFVRPELSLEAEISASDLSREKVERMRKAAAPVEPTAPHLAYREKELAKRKTGSRMAAIAAWGGTAALFVAAGAAAIVMRNDVVKVFPEASSAYAMAGLEVNRFGLEFADVSADRIFNGTTPVLTVTGSIVNISKRAQIVPNVRVDLRDDAGADVESVLIAPEATSIAPGETITFHSRIDSPALEAYDLAVTFVEVDDSMLRLAAPSETGHASDHEEEDGHNSTSDDHHAVEDDHHPVEDDHHPAPAEDDHHAEPSGDAHHPQESGDDHHPVEAGPAELAESSLHPHDPVEPEHDSHDEHG